MELFWGQAWFCGCAGTITEDFKWYAPGGPLALYPGLYSCWDHTWPCVITEGCVYRCRGHRFYYQSGSGTCTWNSLSYDDYDTISFIKCRWAVLYISRCNFGWGLLVGQMIIKPILLYTPWHIYENTLFAAQYGSQCHIRGLELNMRT